MTEYKNLKRVAEEELEALDKKYEKEHQFTKEDACIYKDLMKGRYYQLVNEAMEERKHEEEMYGDSYTPRNAMGQYTSRDMEPMMSGHYPPRWYPRSYAMMPPEESWMYRGRNW